MKDATAELAWRILKGDSLLPDQDTEARIRRKKIKVGDIEKDVSYFAGGGDIERKEFLLINGLLTEFIRPNTVVVRA